MRSLAICCIRGILVICVICATRSICAIWLASACSRVSMEPTGKQPPGPTSCAQLEFTPGATGLYTDAEIRKFAPFDIDEETAKSPEFQSPGIFPIPCLDVVPNGKSYPRWKVFEDLSIDQNRVRNLRQSGINSVVFLTW